jgi:hypothetical protein
VKFSRTVFAFESRLRDIRPPIVTKMSYRVKKQKRSLFYLIN